MHSMHLTHIRDANEDCVVKARPIGIHLAGIAQWRQAVRRQEIGA